MEQGRGGVKLTDGDDDAGARGRCSPRRCPEQGLGEAAAGAGASGRGGRSSDEERRWPE